MKTRASLIKENTLSDWLPCYPANLQHTSKSERKKVLQYKIHVRPSTQADFSKDCPFPIIDDHAYAVHLGALIEDIASLPEIKSTPSSDGNILIYSILNEHELKNRMKPLFSREFCHVKFVSIETLKK